MSDDKYLIDRFFPHNWSRTLFYHDLMIMNKIQNDIEIVTKYKDLPYLEMYHKVNGADKKIPYEFTRKVYELFNEGVLMLYFEDVFLSMIGHIDLHQFDDTEMFKFLSKLNQHSFSEWDEIVKNDLNCPCINFFINDPFYYFPLDDKKPNDIETMKKLKIKLGYVDDISKNIIGPNFMTRNLIKIYLKK